MPKVQFKEVRKFLTQEQIQMYHKINSSKNWIQKLNKEEEVKV